MFNQNEFSTIDTFRCDLQKYLPMGNYNPIVSYEEQNEVLEKLRHNTSRGRFSFILDAQTFDLKHQEGISKWLGYPDTIFSIKKYLEITHPSHNLAKRINFSCYLEAIDTNRDWVNFYDITMVFGEALKHANGHYIYFRCEALPFQFTKDKKSLELAYEFSILKNHDIEDFSVNFYDKNGERKDMLQWMTKAKKKKFAEGKFFSFQEMRILNCYAYNDKQFNMENIATRFKISRETVATYNTRIIAKAEKLFYYQFDNAREVASHLKLAELI